MPTERCSTEPRAERGLVAPTRAAAADVAALLALRRARVDPRRARWTVLVVALLTLAAVTGPAYLGGPVPRPQAGNLLALLPSSALAFLALAVVTAVAAAGGRELLPREEAVAFPVSPTADHLGALLLAPVNVAWMLQAWVLLGLTSYAAGPQRWAAAVLPVVLWVLLATALAQCVGWWVEGLRRGPRGTVLFRLLLLAVALVLGAVVATGRTTAVLDRAPTGVVLDAVLAGMAGAWATWAAYAVGLLVALATTVVVGSLPARWALRRPMRAELELEGGRHPARPDPLGDLAAAVRLDRASVWRSVPLRRGLAVLAVMPGLVALAGSMPWHLATVLPGLVAAGGALLFGVNAWCLDGRGALWRESLPVAPRTVFLARSWVLLELLLGSALVTVLLVAAGSGLPGVAEAAAVLGCLLVVSVQVTAAALRWSQSRPYAVDLRSARATPAPPAVMVGYSARLALSTTVTALVFTALSQVGSLPLVLVVVVSMLVWSGLRWERAAQRWERPHDRARVVMSVTG